MLCFGLMIVKQNFSESRLRILFWMKERLKLKKNPTSNICDPPIIVIVQYTVISHLLMSYLEHNLL